jgi:hypothetical protein
VTNMAAKDEDIVMMIDKPHFKVVLYKSLLKVDLKEGIRSELEKALESRAAIRENIGFLFQNIIPLDVPLRNIDSVEVDEKGQVKIVIPRRKDLRIPLTLDEAEKLAEKLNELISIEKEKMMEEMQESARETEVADKDRAEAYEEETKRRMGIG